MAARSTAAVTASLLLHLHQVGDGAALTHSNIPLPALSPKLDQLCVRRLYVSYVDRLKQHLLLSVDWVVAARPVEDAAGGRRPAACCCCLHAHDVCALPSRDPVHLTVILRLLPWRGGRVRQEPISSTSFWRGLHFPVQKHLGDSLYRCAYSQPRRHQVKPSALAGGSRVQLPGGAGSIPACTGRL